MLTHDLREFDMYAEQGRLPPCPTEPGQGAADADTLAHRPDMLGHLPALNAMKWPFSVACQALERAGMALIIVDSQCALHCSNQLASPYFSSVFRLLDGRLRGVTQHDTRRLMQAVARATAPAQATPPAQAQATMIELAWPQTPDSVSDPIMVLVAPIEASTRITSTDRASTDRLAMLLFAVPDDPARFEARLRQTYGLTRAESRLLAALTNGMQTAEYAAANGIEVTTVKSHLRGLLAKTGQKRQVGLVRKALVEHRLRADVPPSLIRRQASLAGGSGAAS